ncbi:hypothetical protein FQN57_006923 [Myotisia sp. PD_48]|nr:hypothetical protein FQN57_006923 [Myotisia sp. PD_48]
MAMNPAGISYYYMPPANGADVNFKAAHHNNNDPASMHAPSSSTTSIATDYTTYPLIRQHGRTYLRDPENPYPLPCDIAEIHRQSLRTLTLMSVMGGPFCTPHFDKHPPKRVLELACGSGLWSSACHEYFTQRGHSDISFTGLDIANIAPDLSKQGVDWQFKRHDLRKRKLPFPNATFDFVFVKDASMCSSTADLQSAGPLSETLRVLKPGGVVEIWDSDLIFRTLLPNPPGAPGITEEDEEQANATGTYTISPATPWTDAQNMYLKDYNAWIQKAFEARKLNPMPCATISLGFTSESDSFSSSDSRRVAIPLGEVKWEQKQHAEQLTPDQLALRQTTLLTIVEMIESMEPMLMEASGKGKAEWDRWWTGMTTDILQKGGVSSGECLEIGAWWGQKR